MREERDGEIEGRRERREEIRRDKLKTCEERRMNRGEEREKEDRRER